MTIPTFPVLTGRAWPFTRTTLWSTTKETAFNGASTAFSNWSYPRYQWTLNHAYLGSGSINGATSNTDWQTLAGFYDQMQGSSGLFQFAFAEDSSVTTQAFGTGNGSTVGFQLARTLGGATCPVYAWLTASIFVNGVLKTLTTDYTIDAYGFVTFVVAPGNTLPLTWTGTYNWYCRFDDDSIDFSNVMTRIWAAPKLSFTSVKFGSAV